MRGVLTQISKDEFRHMYIDQNMTYDEIARAIDVSRNTIARLAMQHTTPEERSEHRSESAKHKSCGGGHVVIAQANKNNFFERLNAQVEEKKTDLVQLKEAYKPTMKVLSEIRKVTLQGLNCVYEIDITDKSVAMNGDGMIQGMLSKEDIGTFIMELKEIICMMDNERRL